MTTCSPACAISNSIRCAREWSGPLATIARPVIKSMPAAASTPTLPRIPCIWRSARIKKQGVMPTGNCSEARWIQTRCIISGPRFKPGLRWGTIASNSRLSRPCIARSGNRAEAGPRKLLDKGTDPFSQSFNRRHRRVGHVLQGRFKAILVDKDSYLLELSRYIVLNPVRAKMDHKLGSGLEILVSQLYAPFMARPLRIEYAGAVYHVTARGNARESIYKDDGDRKASLGSLGKTMQRHHRSSHAYCLMGNHY